MKIPPSDPPDENKPSFEGGHAHYVDRIVWRAVPPVGIIRGSSHEPHQLQAGVPALLIFSTRLKQARELRGMSQRQLGERIGLGKATGGVRVNRYEQQTSCADIRTAFALATALNVPLAYLFADTEELAAHILTF